MFDYRTSLVNAPELNAYTLVMGCYSYMFRDCSSLKAVKCLASNPVLSDYEVEPSVEGNVDGWLDNVSTTGTFTARSGVSWPMGTIPRRLDKGEQPGQVTRILIISSPGGVDCSRKVTVHTAFLGGGNPLRSAEQERDPTSPCRHDVHSPARDICG